MACAQPTPAPTLTPTPTPTPTTTLTPTPTPTPTSVPTFPDLRADLGSFDEDRYAEDLEDGWADSWDLGPGFVVEDEGGNRVLSAGGPSGSLARYLFGDSWGDYAFEAKVKLVSGEARLHYRFPWVPWRPGYVVGLNSTEVYFGKSQEGRWIGDFNRVPASHNLSQWYTVRIEGIAGHVRVYVDDVLRIDFLDTEPVLFGAIALETLPDSKAQFDDLEVVAKLPFEHTWTRTNGPEGAIVNTIVVDPSNPNIVYAGTEHSAIYKSTDRGLNWRQLGDRNGLAQTKVPELVIAPSAPNILYAAHSEQAGADKSTDGGLHWVRMNLRGEWGRMRALAVHPTDPRVIYAGAGAGGPGHPTEGDGLYMSTDGGESWVRLSIGQMAIFDLAISSVGPNVLYAGTAKGVFKTEDGGRSWREVNNGLTDLLIGQLVIDPLDPDTVYVRVGEYGGAILRTVDGGEGWRQVWDFGSSLAVAPSNPAIVYLADGGGLNRSADGGESWELMNRQVPGGRFITAIAVDPSNPDRVYAGTWGKGVFLSEDRGRSWVKPQTPFLGDWTTALAVHPRNGDIVYAAHGDGEISKTTDGGASWTPLTSLGAGKSERSLTALAIHPLNPDLLFAANLGGVFRSTDEGGSWRQMNNGLTDSRIISLALDPTDTNRLYAGTGSSKPYAVYEGTGLLRSLDGGESWERVPGLPEAPVPTIVINPLNPEVVYAALMGRGVYRSLDGGDTWTKVNEGIENFYVYTLAMDPENPNILYAGSHTFYGDPNWNTFPGPGGLYKTENGGRNWEIITEGLMFGIWIENIVVDPIAPRSVYISDHGQYVWHSPDGGKTWELAKKGLVRTGAHLYMFDMVIDPSGSVLYLANCGQGMYRNLLKEPENPFEE